MQAAKTYLERHYESFPGCSADELISHGLRAVQASLQEGELTAANCTVALVGKDTPFTVLEDESLAPYIALIKEEPMAAVADTAAAAQAAGEEQPSAEGGAAPMET